MNRIRTLESIRGLLAMWVVIGHTLKHAGLEAADLGLLGKLAHPELAVDVFIILSGFVIFLLLDQRKTSYSEFILNRWFRIAPLFLTVVFISALTLQWQTDVISSTPFSGPAILTDLLLHRDSSANLFYHIIAHISMLHGMIDDKFLSNSSFAIVGQGWSISVEWQFYLIAPLIFNLIYKKRWHGLLLVSLLFFAIRLTKYGNDGFAIKQMAYFIIGISSYYAWKISDGYKIEPRLLDLFAFLSAMLIWFTTVRSLSLIVWSVIMYVVIAQRQNVQSGAQRLLIKMLQNRALLAVGAISYSVYLVHMLVLYSAQAVVTAVLPGIDQLTFATLMLAIVTAGTLLISTMTYRFVEIPGIAAGRKLNNFARQCVLRRRQNQTIGEMTMPETHQGTKVE